MVVHVAIHVVDGIVGLLVGVKHNEAVALALARLLVLDHIHAKDSATIWEQRVQIRLIRLSNAVHIDDMSIGLTDRIQSWFPEVQIATAQV